MDRSESISGKDEESGTIRPELEKNRRWALEHWALYVIFALEKTSGSHSQKISFLKKRRSYKRFDKDFAELLLKTFECENFNDNNLREKKVEELAKRTKSKFNTLKRSFFKSKKLKIPDFPVLIYSHAQKLRKEGKTKFLGRLVAAMEAWRESFDGSEQDLAFELPLDMKFPLEVVESSHQDI